MSTIKFRRGTAAQWTAANPVLAAGEPGLETDTGKHKIGDGTTAWNGLPSFLDEDGVSASIDERVRKGHPDGTAPLDSDSRVPLVNLPEGVGHSLIATRGDQTARINAYLAATVLLGGARRLVGSFSVSGTLVFAASDATVDLSLAVITSTSANATTLSVTGDRSTIVGGRIVSPARWNGTNSTWSHAVVLVTGADCTVRGMSLTNVPRVGIGFKHAAGVSRVQSCTIEGNYPAASWTEVETMHFGIGYDPGITSAKLLASGNTVRSCVQGVFLGNFGSGSSSGSIVTRNTFEGCHNHAVYGSAGCTDILVSLNTATNCSRPVALTGAGHGVSHNIFTTTLASGNLSEACGIQIRDAVDCTVSFNRMKGSVHSTAPAVDLVRSGTNTALSGNQVIGNRIEVTGTNTAVGIRIGSGAETTTHGNIVSENTVRAPGVPHQGVIAFFGATASQAFGGKCINNVVTITGNAHGIYVSEQRGLDINGNHIRLEYDAPSATTLGAVFITNNSTGTKVRHNDIECTSAWGTNVTLRGIFEGTNVMAGRYGPNRYSFDLTKLAAGVTHVIQGTSGSILDEALPGAPTTVCGPGSRWMRTDGGASTTLYLKETAASSATWRAV